MDIHALLFGNSARDLAVAAAIAAGLLAILAAIVLLARRKLRNAEATETRIDDFFYSLARRARLWLLSLPCVYTGARVLTLPASGQSGLKTAASLSIIVQGALWAGGLVDFAVDRYRARLADSASVTTMRAFRFAALLVVWAVALLLVLDNLGVQVTPLVTGLGIGGVAVALALQSILGDLFASLSIVLDKPFLVGDAVGVDGDVAIVEHIGLKTTRLRALSGEQLVFANGELLKLKIRNYKRMERRRVVFRIGVVYQTSAEKLERIPSMVRAAIEAASPATFDRCHFATFADSAYEFEIVYYVESPDYNVYMDANQAINLWIVRCFEAEKIEFAYPTRTLFTVPAAVPGELHAGNVEATAGNQRRNWSA